MSQHYYASTDSQGTPVHVLAGWDRPLGHFFLVVSAVNRSADDEDGPIYSNLDDPHGGHSQVDDFSYYQGVLSRLGITVPAAMIEAIEQDGVNNTGNRTKDWSRA